MSKTIMLAAGEASGDLHGAGIVKYLKATDPGIHCVGMGSRAMRDAGVELLYDSNKIAVMGLFEVLAHWSDIQQALKILKQYLLDDPPDLLLLIDYQEFNLKLATVAKQAGIKVLFYVSPQVWAWRSWRVKKIGRAIDMMAVIFPFEAKFYEQHNVPVRYVGHPLTNKVKPTLSREQAIATFKLNPHKKTVALLPGSRRSEIKYILPIIAETATLIQQAIADVQFLLPVASSIKPEWINELLLHFPSLNITLTDGQTYDVVYHSDAAVVASGTATLEVALLGTPMAIVYRISALSYAILKRLIKIKHVGLANIVAEEEVAKEFIQHNAIPSAIAAEIIKQLNDAEYRAAVKNRLECVTHKLGAIDGIEGISNLALEMLEH